MKTKTTTRGNEMRKNERIELKKQARCNEKEAQRPVACVGVGRDKTMCDDMLQALDRSSTTLCRARPSRTSGFHVLRDVLETADRWVLQVVRRHSAVDDTNKWESGRGRR